jgi:hypothetical protein
MIIFWQHPYLNPKWKEGIIMETDFVKKDRHGVMVGDIRSTAGGGCRDANCVNLETGEVIHKSVFERGTPLPAWVLDPTLRAIKVAMWKQQQGRKRRKKGIKKKPR